jgi:hypothetical protein
MLAFWRKQFLLIFLLLALAPNLVHAKSSGWSWGVAYHNPPNSTLGLNFMYAWTNWAMEAGIGYINSTDSEAQSATGASPNTSTTKDFELSVGGDMNLKYLFGSGPFRPFLQGGSYLGASVKAGNATGAAASIAGGFVGAGFYVMNSNFDFYLGYLSAAKGSWQFGFNF